MLIDVIMVVSVVWGLETKAFTVICCTQVHFGRGDLPVSDYVTDTKTVLDGSLRFMQVRWF